MKIVLVGTFGLEPKGTVSMRAIPLGIALSQRGHHVTVVTPPWDNPTDSGKSFFIGDIEVINVKLPPRIPLLWYLILTYRMLRTINTLRPDVVHCFKPKAFAGLVADALWILKKLRLSKVKLVMDTDDLEGEGGWNDIGSYSFLQRWFFASQEKRGLRHADTVTAASVFLVQFAQSLGIPEKRIHYIPNGASMFQMGRLMSEKLDVRTLHGLGKNPVILLYTRFFEFSLPRVVQVISGIFEKVKDANLLVVGKGLFGEEEVFKEILDTQKIADRVKFAGWVQPECLGSYFSASDIALYPMDDTILNRTKCPVKLIDLLFAGLPVIADRVGQTEEYIEDGISGHLVNPEDPAAFAAKAILLLKDNQLRVRLGRLARERMMTSFMWDELAKGVEEAYSRA